MVGTTLDCHANHNAWYYPISNIRPIRVMFRDSSSSPCFSKSVAVCAGPFNQQSSRRTHRRTSRTCITATSDKNQQKQGFVEFTRDKIAGKPGLESEKIDRQIRQKAEAAIKSLGGRVTVGDVASLSGLTLFQAETALKALAVDSQATLAVSNDGEILYCFPSNFAVAIQSKSFLINLESARDAIKEVGAYLIRVMYGTALISSILVVTMAILVLISASSRDERRSNNSVNISFAPRLWFNMTDIFWYFDPFYYQRRYERMQSGSGSSGMSFVEAVFSFVFGDGDPNFQREELRWRAIGEYIFSRGGVVAAEELKPFLDVDAKKMNAQSTSSIVLDESYVLPVLTRFGGSPEVDAEGHILYSFPAFQSTGQQRTNGNFKNIPYSYELAKEKPWKLTQAEGGQLVAVVALGLGNLLGVGYLSVLLSQPANLFILARNGLGWVIGSMPGLQLYAISFFLIPLFRWVVYQSRNVGIEERNKAKDMAATQILNPSHETLKKLAQAAILAKRNVVSSESAVYRSDKGLEEQVIDIEGDLWERRLERRALERDFQQRRSDALIDNTPNGSSLQQQQQSKN